MSFSILTVILNWNFWEDTVYCINALNDIDTDIVVIDNASDNDSIEKIKDKFSQLDLYCSNYNKGFGGGNNLILTLKNIDDYEYIWLLNNDTAPQANALSEMVKVMESDTKIGAVGSVLKYMHNPEQVQAWGGGVVDTVWGITRHHVKPSLRVDYLTAASLLIRTQLFKQLQGFDEKFFMYWEDVDLCLRVKAAGYKLAVAEKSIVLHKESASVGKMNPRKEFLYSESWLYFMYKHGAYKWLIPVLYLLRILRKIYLPKFVVAQIKAMTAFYRKIR